MADNPSLNMVMEVLERVEERIKRVEGHMNGLPCGAHGERIARVESGAAWAKGLGIGVLLCVLATALKVWIG